MANSIFHQISHDKTVETRPCLLHSRLENLEHRCRRTNNMGSTPERRQKTGGLWKRCSPRLEVADIFPPIEDEFGAYKHYFKGNVLNAGAGHRDIRSLVEGKLFNQDIPIGLHNANIDIFSPLHQIPVEAGFFDAIICNAVLEHVENPEEVMREFQRVCKPGGILYLTVPFMQPEHLDPTDFQRYTIAGLKRLVQQHGFEVVEAGGVHSVYTTLAWVFREWLNAANSFEHFLLKWMFFPYLKRKCRRGGIHVHSLASAYRVVGRKRAL
jgi:SAM-dependent methyltransferase